MNGGSLRALSSSQLWSEDDRYHISTQAHWSLRVPDEHPCTIQSMHQHSVHSVLQTSTHHTWEKKKKKTHKSAKYDRIYIYIFVFGPRPLPEGECCIIVRAETANCVPGFFFFNQCSIQSFSFQNSWLQKYISVWEARH